MDEFTVFYCILYFSALESLEMAVTLQEAVLDTHEELIHTHQAMSVVLKCLGREEEAEREMELAGECAKSLDSLEILQTSEEKGWVVSGPIAISSGQAGKCRKSLYTFGRRIQDFREGASRYRDCRRRSHVSGSGACSPGK